MNNVVLCSTSELLNHPQYLGLNIDAQGIKDLDWLKCYSDGNLFRQYCSELKEHAEIWIVSADNIDAINLAAAVKLDRPDLNVCVIAFDLSGSLQSRAGCANIDAVMTKEMFCERFMAYANLQNGGVIQKPQNVASAINSGNAIEDSGPASGKQGFLLPIVSATGGSGKSVVSVMSSILSQLAGNKTLLIDSNLQFSEVSNMLDAKNTIPVDVLLADPAKISELEPTETSPAVLAAPTKPELAENVILEIPKLIDSLRASFECIIVNTGNYWNELTASLLERASKSLFIVDQRPSSLSATKQAMELCTRCGIATTSFLFAVNRCKKGMLYSAIDVSCALGGVSVAEISDGGIDVDNAFMSQNPLDLIESKNAFALSMWNIVSSILPSNPSFNDNKQHGRASFNSGGEKKSKRSRKKAKVRKSTRKKRA